MQFLLGRYGDQRLGGSGVTQDLTAAKKALSRMGMKKNGQGGLRV